MNNASSFVLSSAPIVQYRRSGSRLPQSAEGRLRPIPPLWPPASAISPSAERYDSGIQDSLRGSWIGTRPVMSTGPILVLAKPPKSRRAKKATRLYNELPTFSLSADPNRKVFSPWVLQEMSRTINTTQFGTSDRGRGLSGHRRPASRELRPEDGTRHAPRVLTAGTSWTTSSTRAANSILQRRPPSIAVWMVSKRHYLLVVVPAVCHPHILSGLAEATIPALVLHQVRTCGPIATSQPRT